MGDYTGAGIGTGLGVVGFAGATGNSVLLATAVVMVGSAVVMTVRRLRRNAADQRQ